MSGNLVKYKPTSSTLDTSPESSKLRRSLVVAVSTSMVCLRVILRNTVPWPKNENLEVI